MFIHEMDYKNTVLWSRAFEATRADATSGEQTRLSACYESMRHRATALVAKIAADLPHMTVHDVTHLDALWEMGSIVCGNQVDLNPAEAFVFGGAVLLHDAAMTLAAYPKGLADLRQTTEWRDLHARYLTSAAESGAPVPADLEGRVTEDALRLLHAKQAENLPKISWMGPHGEALYLIEDSQVRNFYGPKIGKIAFSHWWSVNRVEDELAGTLGALAGITDCTVDLLKVACLLRVSDAMHLDQRRAPAFEFALSQPTGVSAEHWKFQERMAKPFVHFDALVYTAQPPFEVEAAEAWWTAFDALQMVDRELRDVDRVLRDRQKTPLLVRRVEGVHSPSDLANRLETVGWTPVDSTIRVTDVPKIVSTLGGDKLYGSDTKAPIRELIQNGLDAITARRRLQSRPSSWGQLQVALEKRADGYWLCVEDNGVGMSTTVLTGPLIDFGNSFWKSSLAIQEFPGLASAGMKPRGKYGIGFFSVFMLGDHVRVVTRRFDRAMASAKVLEFRNGLGSRPNLKEASADEAPIDGGTRVEVRLRLAPTDKYGILSGAGSSITEIRKRWNEVISAIAPASDVSIRITSDSKDVGSIAPGDWLKIKSNQLLRRVASSESKQSKSDSAVKLTELRDEDGRVYGRARIQSEFWSSRGLIVVDGLTATRTSMFDGILVGVETTASRNSAVPIVPAPVLAAWASEQAIAISNADLSDWQKADAADVVLACGGDAGDLPILEWQDEWMSAARLKDIVAGIDRLTLHDGPVRHDDDDDVRKRDFNQSFEADPSIARTANSSPRHFMPDWIAAVVQGEGETSTQLIEQVLVSAWTHVEYKEDMAVVGNVNGIEIHRHVRVYSPALEKPDDVEGEES